MASSNNAYWMAQAGGEYRKQQEWRTEQGNTSYRAQEEWIANHFEQTSEQAGRMLDVLDFGCGFGRMARLLAKSQYVRYHGYDFSTPMVQELLDAPPEGLEPLSARVRVADTAPEAFPDQQFDVIFTVSVLIHNAREGVTRLLSDMASMLRSDGCLLLIENQMVPFDLKENNWHAGCWLHDYAGDVARDFDVDIVRDKIPNHDIYVLRRIRQSERTVLLFEGDNQPRALSEAERLQLSLPRLQLAIQGLESELQYRNVAEIEGNLHDLAEQNAAFQREVNGQRDQIDEQQRLIDEQQRLIDEQRKQFDDITSQRDALLSVQHLRAHIQQALAQASAESQPVHIVPDAGDDSAARSFVSAFPPARTFEWHAPRDTMYANDDERFAHVCHVFHHDWMGIRSAAGSLPGWKLSIPSATAMSPDEVAQITMLFQQHGIVKLVLHGISDPMYALSRALATVGYDAQYLVWHGTTAQWVWDDERRFAQRAIKMAREGMIRRFSAIRRGLGPIVGERDFSLQLVNMPPKVSGRPIPRRQHRLENCDALAPSWNDLRKNLATNVLAAQAVEKVGKIYVVANDFQLPTWLAPKVSKVSYREHTSMLEMMATVDVVLNVTVIDCHPMVQLEATAVGTPCVVGPLFLDTLEDHEYMRMTVVDNPFSVEDISRRVDKILCVDETELQEMMSSYKTALLDVSLQRYAEFLEI